LLVDEARGGAELTSGAMLHRVVSDTLLPALPDHAAPGAREDADRVGMLAAAFAGALVDGGRPRVGVAGGVGESGERRAQPHVARPAEADGSVLARLSRDRGDATLPGEVIGTHEATAVGSQLG